MKNFLFFLLLAVLAGCAPKGQQYPATTSADEVERWGTFEVTIPVASGALADLVNPFDVKLTATFEGPDTALTVDGFYDGDTLWRVRFMPQTEGQWRFSTHSTMRDLDGRNGSFLCVAPTEGNHGPVRVDTTGLHFCYADGTPYMPVGTTSYDWMHASNDPAFSVADSGLTMQQQTLVSLGQSGFNKIRSLLIVQNFDRTYPEPDLFPFEMLGREWIAEQTDDASAVAGGNDTQEAQRVNGHWEYQWDWTRPNPRYFDHVEACTRGLMALGIEQDLILFHPYDGGRWGFDAMPREAGELLCRYVGARMSSMRNVWWSMANEYDFLKAQPRENWDAWTDAIIAADPYRHLISIHSYTARYYEYWDPRYTHCSVQDQAPVEDFGRAATVRNILRKPVIFDEVCYEGDMSERWGWLSGQEELYRMWQALIAGTYCTHSECFQFGDPHDFGKDFLAVGGKWQGQSWARIGFMRQVLAAMPRPMYLADSSWDVRTSSCGPGYYMVYLGKEAPRQWRFDLPIRNLRGFYPRLAEGERYTVDVIDTWNMTIERRPEVYVTRKQDNYRMIDAQGRAVPLPGRPYILLRIQRVEE